VCAVQGVETAMEWLLTKTDDETLDDPLDSDEEAEDKVGIACATSIWDLQL
jgi:hypothetical protein